MNRGTLPSSMNLNNLLGEPGGPAMDKEVCNFLSNQKMNMHDPLNAASRERNSRTGYSLSTIYV